jgi:hypothetical protein
VGASDADYFEVLGSLVDQRWDARGRTPASLAEVGRAALAELAPPDSIDAASVLRRLARNDALPKQRSSRDPFGQPPTVLYLRDDLEIQALTWIQGSTEIHQHGFDGAFRLLEGSSLHVTYEFAAAEELADGHLIAGELFMVGCEVLRKGDVRAIPAGPSFIHSLFHLERPSVTIVVRNRNSGLPFPQYSYHHPGVAVDALFEDDPLVMRLRALQSLRTVDPQAARRTLTDLVRHEDLWTAYRVADYWFMNFSPADGFAELSAELGRRDSSLAPLLDDMYQERSRRDRLMLRRGMLEEQRHRLLLAVLINVPDTGAIAAAMKELFPEQEPAETMWRLIEELVTPRYRGLSGMTLPPDELERVRRCLAAGDLVHALVLLGDRWRPPTVEAVLQLDTMLST